MENFTQLRKSFSGRMLWGMLTLFACMFAQAQTQLTVTVPMDCKVVVPGTGGTPGFGGTVGNGGIVTMPDPGNGDFTINENGNTPINWRLLGDASFSNPFDPDPIIKQSKPVTTLTETIYSYNKIKRESERDSPSNEFLARSMGWVSISYERERCNGSINFHIYKKYSNTSGTGDEYVPPIVGAECWLPNKEYTYSVDQIASDNLEDAIGIDEYYWTVYKDGTPYPINVRYYSADKSSITFITPPDISGEWYIECCYGKANAIVWGERSTTCVTKSIGLEPERPELNIPTCVAIGQTNFVISVTNAVPGYTYNWSSSNSSWTFSDATGAATTVSSLGEGSGTIILTVENPACGQTTEFEYPVGRSFVSPDVYIEERENCLTPGEAYLFSIMPTGVQANQTQWLVNGLPIESTDWEIDEGGSNGTHSVANIIVPNSATPGTYTISAYSCSDAHTVSVEVTVRPQKPEIDTPAQTNYCINSGSVTPIVFTVEPVGTYQWTIPDGWSSNNSTTETIILTPDGLTTGEVKAFAVGVSENCGSADPAVWEVNFHPIEPAGIEPVACWNFGYDAQNTIIVSNAPSPFFGTYVVTDPSGILVDDYNVDVNGQIILETSGDAPAGIYNLNVSHITDCGSSSETIVPVNFNSNGISVSHMDWGPFDYFLVDGVPSNTPVEWVIGGQNYSTSTPTINVPLTTPTPVACATVEVDGCTTTVCYVPPQNFSNKGNDTSGILSENRSVKIYPNPNNGTFNVNLENVTQSADVKVFDVQGKLIGEYPLKKGENTLNERVSAGTYMLLINVDGKMSAHKIQVNK